MVFEALAAQSHWKRYVYSGLRDVARCENFAAKKNVVFRWRCFVLGWVRVFHFFVFFRKAFFYEFYKVNPLMRCWAVLATRRHVSATAVRDHIKGFSL